MRSIDFPVAWAFPLFGAVLLVAILLGAGSVLDVPSPYWSPVAALEACDGQVVYVPPPEAPSCADVAPAGRPSLVPRGAARIVEC